MDKIKILIFMSTAALGGFEKMVYHLVKNINKSRFDVNICVLYGEGVIGERLAKDNYNIIFFKHENNSLTSIVTKFYRLVSKNRYDILYLAGYKVNIMGRIIGKILGCKVITAQRSTDDHRSKLHDFIDSFTTSMVDMYITNTNAAKDMLVRKKHINAERITVIYNGIDIDNYTSIKEYKKELLGIRNETKVIGVVANLIPYKGHEYFLKALRELSSKIDDICAILIGDGENRSYLEDLVERLKIKDKILFLGVRSDVPSLLSLIDVFVLPSLFEGMPNAIMEAMASRKPVVATQVGGVPELVIDGETGYLIPPKEPEIMAKKIFELLSDIEKSNYMGQKAFERINSYFTMEKMVILTEAKIEKLITK